MTQLPKLRLDAEPSKDCKEGENAILGLFKGAGGGDSINLYFVQSVLITTPLPPAEFAN